MSESEERFEPTHPCDCTWWEIERERRQRWEDTAFGQVRRVLECHALGAEVIALKDAKHERLEALHALETLGRIQRDLYELRGLAEEPTNQ